MSGALDMSLDDMVKKSKNERSAGRGGSRRGGRGSFGFRGGARGIGAVRRGPLAVNARPSSFSINKPARRVRRLPWHNELFEESIRAAGISGVEVGTRLYVSNLDQGVTNQDIRELFSEIGELKRYAIHFDKNGRPSGTAEVVYLRRSDAFQALKRYNNVLLDGRPMKIEFLGSNIEAPVSARVNVTGLNGKMKRTVVMTQGVGRGRGNAPLNHGPYPNRRGGMKSGRGGGLGGRGGGLGGRGGRGGGRGRGRGGRGRGKKPSERSAADLDKDLDNYHSEAMNIA